MNQDKEALWLQFIGCCSRQNVDPGVIFFRKRFKGEMYDYARSKLLKDAVVSFGYSQASKLTGYSTKQLRRIATAAVKTTTIAAILAVVTFLVATGITLSQCANNNKPCGDISRDIAKASLYVCNMEHERDNL